VTGSRARSSKVNRRCKVTVSIFHTTIGGGNKLDRTAEKSPKAISGGDRGEISTKVAIQGHVKQKRWRRGYGPAGMLEEKRDADLWGGKGGGRGEKDGKCSLTSWSAKFTGESPAR